MLSFKRIDIPFCLLIFASIELYAILAWFNILRFNSLNPLSLSPGDHEQLFRWLLFSGNIPYPLKFPCPELFTMPLIFLGSYVFNSIFWMAQQLCKTAMPYSSVLLLAQPVFFILTVFPLYRLAEQILENKYLALAVAFSYLSNQLVFIGSTIGFIFACVGLPLLMLEIYFILRRKLILAMILLILANAVRVDVICMNMIFGLILFFSYRDKEIRKFGMSIFFFSTAWFLALLVFAIPKINLALVYSTQYGPAMPDSLVYLIAHPIEIFWALDKLFFKMCMVYLVHVLFLPIFSLQFLVPMLGTIPILIFRGESTSIFLNLAFVYLAVIFGTKSLMSRSNKIIFPKVLASGLIIFSCVSHYFYHYSYIDHSVGVVPFSRGFSIKANLPNARQQSGLEILKTIPVSTSCFTIVPLAQRLGYVKKLGIYRKTPLTDYAAWEYYFFPTQDLQFVAWNFDALKYFKMIQDILQTRHYDVVTYENGWLLLKKAPLGQVDVSKIEAVLRDINQSLRNN